MGILWTIIIGFVAGIIAKFIMPGDNEPSGFILTTMTVPTKVLALAPNNALARTFLGLAQISSRRVGAGLKGPTYNKFLGEIPNICAHGVNEARFTHLT